MNLRLVARLLGMVAWLIGGAMLFSLPWAWPALGHGDQLEVGGLQALLFSMLVCGLVGLLLRRFGKQSYSGMLYRKEAMAIVGLSWVLATILGALPYLFAHVGRGPAVRLFSAEIAPKVGAALAEGGPLSAEQFAVIEALVRAPSQGLTTQQLIAQSKEPDAPALLRQLAEGQADWRSVLILPDQESDPYQLVWTPMNFADCLFEAQSGFSTTGATVLTRLEDKAQSPRCILFWRSSTNFLGGLGIIVLFVAILGQGSAGKALMRAEMVGPNKQGAQTRMQHTAWTFAGIYCALTATLAIILRVLGMNWFDALCHAFATMATGGFSTHDASLGYFNEIPGVNGAWIDYTVTLFMALAGSNFTLLYFLFLRREPGRLLADVEWRAYVCIIAAATFLIVAFGMHYDDFLDPQLHPDPAQVGWWEEFQLALRFGLFQVVSILTTTGFGTHDFNSWNSFGRGMLFLLMFVGGCAGSTAGGLKVIRHVLFLKILGLEIERSFRPNVVRPLRIGNDAVEDPELRRNILVYFGLILAIFVFSWMALVTLEPDDTWKAGGQPLDNKLIDAASSVSATLNNIGPGLGIVGATENYAHFRWHSKLLFTWLMMVGRLEIFVILVLFVPAFWRTY